jgi:predicted nucleic-acid-binding protein
MRAVDTNVLVRLVTGDDERQTTEAERFVEPGAWVSLLALAETTWVLGSVYEKRPADIVNAVDMLLSHSQLTLEDRELVAGALENFRKHPSVGFFDCLLLERARKAGHLPFGTFDRHLSKLDGAEKV